MKSAGEERDALMLAAKELKDLLMTISPGVNRIINELESHGDDLALEASDEKEHRKSTKKVAYTIREPRQELKLTICSEHPKYLGTRRPQNGCNMCQLVYDTKH